MTIGERIRELRKSRKLTQAQLGDKIHLPYQAVSRWETGRGAPGIENLEAVARALGVPVSELVGDNDPELSRFLSLPKDLRDRLLRVVQNPDHLANLAKWLQVFEESSPERQRAILLTLGASGEE